MKWEYLRIDSIFYTKEGTSLTESLNDLGKQGWELVAIVQGSVFYFKRPLGRML